MTNRMYGAGWLAIAMLAAGALAARGQDLLYTASVGGRYHVESSVLPDVPYGDGDWSSYFAFEATEGAGFWQLGLDVGYGADQNEEIDLLLTPQLNLMITDGAFVGGLGILDTYLIGGEDGDEWTDIYFQFSLGFNFEVGRRGALLLLAHYPFEDWGDLDEFDGDDLEFSGAFRYRF